jgi:hypothetical protein
MLLLSLLDAYDTVDEIVAFDDTIVVLISVIILNIKLLHLHINPFSQ